MNLLNIDMDSTKRTFFKCGSYLEESTLNGRKYIYFVTHHPKFNRKDKTQIINNKLRFAVSDIKYIVELWNNKLEIPDCPLKTKCNGTESACICYNPIKTEMEFYGAEK